MNPFTTCAACLRPIREREDDIALSHTSKAKPVLFFHDVEACREIARRMRTVRGANEWALTYRAYAWCPREAEGLTL